MKFDTLGDHLKTLERGALAPALKNGFLYARLDGRTFSTLTKKAEKPFDTRLSRAMTQVTTGLYDAYHATLGYTQSDEISLIWKPRVAPDTWLFSGKRDKWLSVLAGHASALFAKACLEENLTWMIEKGAHFDARLVDGLDSETAASFITWRSEDARRNAIQMCAQARFAKKSLTGQNLGILRKRLDENGTPFDEEPGALRNGTLVHTVYKDLSPARRSQIPEAHRPSPDTPIIRPHTVTKTDTLMTEVSHVLPYLDKGDPRV